MGSGGYDPDFLESIGACRQCGGQKNYPMLVPPILQERLCRAPFHSMRYRIAAWVYKKLTGKEPKQ